MAKNDLRVNEKRWRRKRLFRKRRTHPFLRFITILLILAALAILCWWLEVPPFDLIADKLSR